MLNHLEKGSVFDKAKILRDRMALTRDDGTTLTSRSSTTGNGAETDTRSPPRSAQEGSYKTRYDVTLLVNGLPLVQIELKRRGMELKEAFNQINRYQRHSFWSGDALFQYRPDLRDLERREHEILRQQPPPGFKQTFYWADEDNTPVTRLEAFTDAFLEKCFVSKMIAEYVVLHESDKALMVLRPYQYTAVEKILDRVQKGRKNGYIWHTTGSGKTLTSFKASQVIIENPKVAKVVFVVDRADLDYQTTKEFNYFAPGSVDGTDNTRALVDQMRGDAKLIVTTIQKLNNAITRERHGNALSAIKGERIVFIFDECHRTSVRRHAWQHRGLLLEGTDVRIHRNAHSCRERHRQAHDHGSLRRLPASLCHHRRHPRRERPSLLGRILGQVEKEGRLAPDRRGGRRSGREGILRGPDPD